MPRVFALSLHAAYRCAHSSACCTSGWAIPVEADKRALLGSARLVPGDDGVCRFYDRAARRCAVHRDHGEAALPESCRQFPRLALIDERGVHVTLSHFCPTAARLLFADAPLHIVESPDAFPETRAYEGLDARGEWPPLVHGSLLFDAASYAAWERFVVASLATGPSDAALARVADAAERLRAWTVSDGPLMGIAGQLDASATSDTGALTQYAWLAERAESIVMRAIPEARRPLASERGAHDADDQTPRQSANDDRVISRYLAAKAFASWTAYQGRGVRTLVAELVLSRGLVLSLAGTRTLVDAIREADFRLVHLADRRALVSALGVCERPEASGNRGQRVAVRATSV